MSGYGKIARSSPESLTILSRYEFLHATYEMRDSAFHLTILGGKRYRRYISLLPGVCSGKRMTL